MKQRLQLLTVRRDADADEPGLRSERRRQPDPDRRVIVDDRHAHELARTRIGTVHLREHGVSFRRSRRRAVRLARRGPPSGSSSLLRRLDIDPRIVESVSRRHAVWTPERADLALARGAACALQRASPPSASSTRRSSARCGWWTMCRSRPGSTSSARSTARPAHRRLVAWGARWATTRGQRCRGSAGVAWCCIGCAVDGSPPSLNALASGRAPRPTSTRTASRLRSPRADRVRRSVDHRCIRLSVGDRDRPLNVTLRHRFGWRPRHMAWSPSGTFSMEIP